jgi:cation diffusion facilitator CzcD-associated flavoprotein CzcO
MKVDHDVVIVDAGFGGMGAAIALQRAGVQDYVILERADDLGGTVIAAAREAKTFPLSDFTFS